MSCKTATTVGKHIILPTHGGRHAAARSEATGARGADAVSAVLGLLLLSIACNMAFPPPNRPYINLKADIDTFYVLLT